MNTPQKMPFPTVFVRKRSCTVSSSPVNDCSNIKIAQMNEAVPLLKSDMAVPNQTDEHVLSVAGEHTLSSKQIFMGEEIVNQKSKTETAIQSNIKGKIHKIKAIIKSDLKGEAERNAKIPQEKNGLLSRVKMGVFTAGIVKIRLKKQKKNNKKKNMLKNKSSKSKSAIHTRERDLEAAGSGHLTSEQSGDNCDQKCLSGSIFRKARSAYSSTQVAELEKEFQFNQFVSIPRKAEMASQLNLTQRQIRIWFKNKRAKCRQDQKMREMRQSSDKSPLLSNQS